MEESKRKPLPQHPFPPGKKRIPGVPMFFPPPSMDTEDISRKWLDLPYETLSPTQKLDLYLPEKGQGPFPLIVSIHGGAWLFGDKADLQQVPMMEGLERGYAVACVNYRLSEEATFPAQVQDCQAAIRFLRVNAGKYLLDPDRVAAWGPSAGGHLVALLGTSAQVQEFEDPSAQHAGTSCAVQAVVDWCGPVEDFLKMDEQFHASGMGTPDHSTPESPESKLLGARISTIPERVKAASPMTYINPGAPPFLIQHGELDPVVPVQQSVNFAAALARIAGPEKVTLEVLPGVHHHGDPAFETPENIARVLDFIDSCLKK